MTFNECVMWCFDNKEFVREFNRLSHSSIGCDTRTPIERMVDAAAGNFPTTIVEAEAVAFIEFVREFVWLPSRQADAQSGRAPQHASPEATEA